MSLSNAKMPTLKDKLEAQATAAETVREKAEKKDTVLAKIIKKRARKN